MASAKQPTITVKKLGKNLLAVIDGEKFTKVLKTDEDKANAEAILNKAKSYNVKKTSALKTEIINFFSPAKVEEEKKAVKVKAVAKQMKKAEKKSSKAPKEKGSLIATLEAETELSDEDIVKLEALLKKHKKVDAVAPVAQVTHTPRRGEY